MNYTSFRAAIDHLKQDLPTNSVQLIANGFSKSMSEFFEDSGMNEPFFALKIDFQKIPNMPESGWVFANFLEKCKTLGLSQDSVKILKENILQRIEQFSFTKERSFLLIGYGEKGKLVLDAVVNTQLEHVSNNFDLDGYTK